MPIEASPFLRAGFVGMALVVAAGFLAALAWSAPDAASRRRLVPGAAAGLALWMGATAGLASLGVLSRFERFPPPFLGLLVVTLALAVCLGLSPLGRRLALGLPLWFLVGTQAFRLPLELLMHRAAEEGVMPRAMSYSGLNYDILTGTAALLLGVALWRGARARLGVSAWNAAGALLLLNVLIVAVLSAPTPFRVLHGEVANTWVTTFPFVWLPTVMVPAAVVGHLVVLRRLLHDGRSCVGDGR